VLIIVDSDNIDNASCISLLSFLLGPKTFFKENYIYKFAVSVVGTKFSMVIIEPLEMLKAVLLPGYVVLYT
jgi:hypothetical protein